jgi:TIR domain
MTDFFISYNRADVGWAKWIDWQLRVAGYSTVVQVFDFRPGCNFVAEMDAATREAERTIAVLSPDYLTALFTHPEWGAAFARDPKGEKRLLVPVRVRDCELSGLLAQIVYVDLVGAAEKGAARTLLEGLQADSRPRTPPGFPGGAADAADADAPRYPGTLPPIWNVPHLRNSVA